MRISDWSSDVCSSDLDAAARDVDEHALRAERVQHLAVDHVVRTGAAWHDRHQNVDVPRHPEEPRVMGIGHVLPAAGVVGDGHLEGLEAPGDLDADAAKPEDADAAIPHPVGELQGHLAPPATFATVPEGRRDRAKPGPGTGS